MWRLVDILSRAGFSHYYTSQVAQEKSLEKIELVIGNITGLIDSDIIWKYSIDQHDGSPETCNTSHSRVGHFTGLATEDLQRCRACNSFASVKHYEVIYAIDDLPYKIQSLAHTQGMHVNFGQFTEYFGHSFAGERCSWPYPMAG